MEKLQRRHSHVFQRLNEVIRVFLFVDVERFGDFPLIVQIVILTAERQLKLLVINGFVRIYIQLIYHIQYVIEFFISQNNLLILLLKRINIRKLIFNLHPQTLRNIANLNKRVLILILRNLVLQLVPVNHQRRIERLIDRVIQRVLQIIQNLLNPVHNQFTRRVQLIFLHFLKIRAVFVYFLD